MNGDGTVLSMSGYDIDNGNAFVESYDLDELFYTRCVVDYPDRIGDGEIVMTIRRTTPRLADLTEGIAIKTKMMDMPIVLSIVQIGLAMDIVMTFRRTTPRLVDLTEVIAF